MLATNTYDEVRADYYNIGHLTTSTNAADTQRLDYSAGGVLQRRISGAHTSFTSLSANQSVLHKLYYPGALSIGTNTNRWLYDGAGRVRHVPGLVTDQTYELDGQTKSIRYANG